MKSHDLRQIQCHWGQGIWSVFSYKLRYIVGFWLVEMAISTNQKPTIYRNLYENTGPDHDRTPNILFTNDTHLYTWLCLSDYSNHITSCRLWNKRRVATQWRWIRLLIFLYIAGLWSIIVIRLAWLHWSHCNYHRNQIFEKHPIVIIIVIAIVLIFLKVL